MSDVKLGHLIETPQQRDAVHVAVAPVVAGEHLQPGDHVGIVDGEAILDAVNTIGVVDPFLRRQVDTGESFWLFMYPGSIKGLRHNWEHPLLDAPTESVKEDPDWDCMKSC